MYVGVWVGDFQAGAAKGSGGLLPTTSKKSRTTMSAVFFSNCRPLCPPPPLSERTRDVCGCQLSALLAQQRACQRAQRVVHLLD